MKTQRLTVRWTEKTLFADNTYSKPYLVTYINTAFFIIPLIPILVQRGYQDPSHLHAINRSWRQRLARYTPLSQTDQDESPEHIKPASPRLHRRSFTDEADPMQHSQVLSMRSGRSARSKLPPLTVRETAWLSLEFCILWFLANYFVAACLEYTTVASSTILTSTSSIFTLLFGTIFRVEKFTLRKLLGVLASLAGIVLISTIDLSGSNDKNRGSFPHKSAGEIALGDGMALVSAVLYGIYAVMMKKRIGDERRISMPLFFGLVGLWNVLILWPGFFILHFTGVEKLELPGNGKVVLIIIVNSPPPFSTFTALADRTSDQFALLPHFRHSLGIRCPAHLSHCRHRRPKHYDTTLPHRTDFHQLTAR